MAEKRLLRIVAAGAGALFVLCLPIFLLTANLNWAVNVVRLYEYGFNKYGVSEETGIAGEELSRVARELIGYFNSGDEFIQITVTTEDGGELDLFTEREVLHLREVKGLIGLSYHLQQATFGFLAAIIVGGFIWQRRRFSIPLAKLSFLGAALTIALLIVLGIAALVNFNWLFLEFHRLFFSSDYWMLQPSDYLLRLFPQGFFSDATLIIAGATIVEAVIIGGVGLALLLRRRKRAPAS